MNEKVYQAIEKIKDYINEIEGMCFEEENPQIHDYKEKAVSILSQAAAKLERVATELSDKEIEEVVAFVMNKANELLNKTKERINSIKEQNNNEDVDFETLTESEKIKKVVQSVNDSAIKIISEAKEGIEDYLSRPEVNEKIEIAKDVTIDIAEKAVAGLKAWLKPETDSEEDQ